MKLFHVDVKIFIDDEKKNLSCYVNEEVESVAENENIIVINDDMFHRVSKSEYYGDFELNRPVFFARDGSGNCDMILGRGVFYQLYSTTKKEAPDVLAEIQEYLEKNFTFNQKIDLSIIK